MTTRTGKRVTAEPRTERMAIRLTKEEMAALVSRAKDAKTRSLAEYARAMLLQVGQLDTVLRRLTRDTTRAIRTVRDIKRAA
jgi:hypothetical protein